MKIFDYIKKFFKWNNKIDLIFEQTAYHESGHIIMAYIMGFRSLNVTLIQDNPGSGRTKFDYGQDNSLIIFLLNWQNGGVSLSPTINVNISTAAEKICYTLLGGPVTEALHKEGVGFQGNLKIEISGSDLLRVENIDLFLYHVDKRHSGDFIQDSLSRVINIIRTEPIWSSVNHLAETILNSPNKFLEQNQIEDSLRNSGFMNYLENLRNNV